MACNQPIIIKNVGSPAVTGSALSSLYKSEDGRVFLSWVTTVQDSISSLHISEYDEDHDTFARDKVIAQGNDWFLNWADFPSVVAYPDSPLLLSHWLQKSADGTYDYDIRIAQGRLGEQWNESKVLHSDGVHAEHGFTSHTALGDGRVMSIWLDGRNTSTGSEDHHGAMTLRSAIIDSDGNISDRKEIDAKVCDCCQTDVALLNNVPVAVYRNRSDEEIRDIFFSRYIDGKWSAPHIIHADNWEINGCPVNGPRIDANKDVAVAAWFTGRDDGAVKAAFSKDLGSTFDQPMIISSPNNLGRVDITLLDSSTAAVSYMFTRDEQTYIALRTITIEGKVSDELQIVPISPTRNSGFPRMVSLGDNQIMLTYTDVDSSNIQTVRIKL